MHARLAPAPQSSDRSSAGILCLVSGIAIFSVQDIILKMLSDSYPLHQAMVFRSITALALLLVFVARDGGLRTLRSARAPLLTLRGLTLFSAYTSYYLGLAALPLAVCVSLYFVGPLFTSALSAVFLRERIGAGRWAAVTSGFVGGLIVLRPGSSLFDPAALLPIHAGLAYAITAVMARSLRTGESAPVMAFYGNGVYLAGGLILGAALAQSGMVSGEHKSLAFLLRAWAMPTPRDFLLLAPCGGVAALATVLLTQAYRLAEASKVAPFEYSALLWSLIYGWLFWGEFPDAIAWTGMFIVVASGLLASQSGWRSRGR